ncbi:TPA: hypothetical protein ACYSZB_000216 [Streptococcus suis]|uniref:Uncharacterized protein n=2 Tax=Streptococcus TaxID=1301 RepID=A0A4V0H5R1_STRPO|nr:MULTISPECIES: hypothetical protein [Streptococcus]MCQ8252221.1 hypothetical protein [Streptococcus suis]MDW8584900.1 hypothetical protein [Streptococcus suis]MDW8719200.1 hypothetical protein [Streptococcus suis]MDW8748685.1 hypothetical protein [Streptococcus suis]MDW8752820.1 hypothetical protein [Streptococcus suis]
MIILDTELLEFDITGIFGSEINQHIDFYNDGVNEAYMAIKNNDKSTALSILRALKSQLDREYKYFDSKRFWDFNSLNDAYSYVDGINRASRALVGTPNYRNMNSMLYDIKDYMTRHRYEEDILYGNKFALAVDIRLDEMTNQEYHSRVGQLLHGIRAFYLRPGKGTAKECIELSKVFSQKSLEPYVFKEYFAKYLR